MTVDQVDDLSDLESYEKPHLRLFLSADIVGSTAFKQNSKDRLTESGFPLWFAIVLEFYQVAEKNFQKHWAALDTRTGRKSPDILGSNPELWKTIGDEVLFTKVIDHPGQAIFCMLAWIQTLTDLRLTLRRYKLDVKSTAWVADFPVKNNEIVLQKNLERNNSKNDHEFFIKSNQDSLAAFYKDPNQKDLLRDFIGPSIDTGFRLGAFASARKLVLSIELAYILASEQIRSDDDDDVYSRGVYVLPKFEFKYDGRHSLKGVLSGSPYPVVWIDLDTKNAVYRSEDDVLNTPRPPAEKIKALAKAFLESEILLQIPYIKNCDFSDYSSLTQEEVHVVRSRHISVLKIEETIANEKEAEAEAGAQDVPEDSSAALSTLNKALLEMLQNFNLHNPREE